MGRPGRSCGLGAVLHKEPDWSALPADTPPGIRTLLRRCLEKDAKRRFSSAADLQIQMDEALTAPPTVAPSPALPPPPEPSLWRRLLPWAAAVAVSVAAGALAVWTLKPVPTQPVSRVVIPLPANERLAQTGLPVVALSPDGTHLAYVARRGSGAQQLYVRAMDSAEARPLAGTEGALNPFFSQDGQWIGFFAGGSLKKVAVSGGANLTLADYVAARGGTWGPDDIIVFAPTSSGGLVQVSAAGGARQLLTKLKQGESSHRGPQFLPDGKTVLFTILAGGAPDDAQIAAQRLDSAEHRVLIRGGSYGRYVPTGHLVYYRAGTMMAVPFDPERLEVMGAPVPVLEGVMAGLGDTGVGQFSFSGQGSLAYIQGGAVLADVTAVWVDRNGVVQPLGAPPRTYLHPHLSPDGRQLAVTISGGEDDIWVYDLPRGTLTRLTFEGFDHASFWIPDGKRIVFRSTRSEGSNLFWKPADGTGAEEQITKSMQPTPSLSSVSSDGKLAFYSEDHPTMRRDIWIASLDGERKQSVFLQTPFNEAVPRISPDGLWLAYLSDESGRYEVYVRAFPGPGGKWQISTDGGAEPLWARDGRELFYRVGEKVMAVDITTQPTFQAGTPRVLFEGDYATHPIPPETNFDISPDGQRFLMFQPTEQEGAALSQIHVVLNWFEELKRRVPTR